MKPSDKGIVPTKASVFAASHDIYALTDRFIPAEGQSRVATGIAIGVPEGTYRRLAERSGMASKMGIAVGGGLIDAHYPGELKVILANQGEADSGFKAGDRIDQLKIEKIADADTMEVDDPGTTEIGKLGFGPSYRNPQRSITAKEDGVKIGFLYADTSDNKFFRATDIDYDPWLMEEGEMLSCAHVNAALT